MKGSWTGACALGLLLVGGCATREQDRPVNLQVTLTGLQEVPGPGDPNGTGTAEVRVTPRENQVCWNVYVRETEPATAAHIHRGAAGSAGAPVVPITTPDASGRSQGCATVDPALAREIATQGYNFYLNVHTASHPAGAVRGQLRGGAMLTPRGQQ